MSHDHAILFKGCSLTPSLLLQLEMFQNWRKVCVAEVDWEGLLSPENQAEASSFRTLWLGKDFGSYPKYKRKPLKRLRHATHASQGRDKSEMRLEGVKCEVICLRLRRAMYIILNVAVATWNILVTHCLLILLSYSLKWLWLCFRFNRTMIVPFIITSRYSGLFNLHV